MTAHTLTAVLWDMDGTLIDSEPLWLAAELAQLERFGLSMGAQTHERLIGSGLRDAARHFQELGVPLDIDEIIAEWVRGVSEGISERGLDWRPGAREMLESLRLAGIPCALVTMSVRSLAEAAAAALPEGTFRAIVAGDDVQFEKPHPEPYLMGAERLGVPIDGCLAFEDSPTGLRSASGAGAVAIGVPNLISLDTAPAHELWPSLVGSTAETAREAYARLRASAAPVAQPTAQETPR